MFIFDDVVDALMLASEYKKTDVFNVGTGTEHTFRDVMAILNRLLKKDVNATYKPNPMKNYVEKTLADTSKAENVLKFKAKYSFETGIGHYIGQGQ